MMDRNAIVRLSDKIYPGGDYTKISDIYMAIMTNKNRPFGDDIVCYIILYKSINSAKDELKKMTEFAGYNSDRVIVLSRNNIIVFLHVDDIDDFHYIRNMSETIKQRLEKI